MRKRLLLAAFAANILMAGAQTDIGFASTIKVETDDSEALIIEKAAHVVPTFGQMQALNNEFIAFVHFGPNTFTRKEWGNGMEDPKIFDLKTLDTDQWVRTMKAAGMKMVLFTAKHHDGFVLWQSRYTKHGIMSTGFQNGKGDILRDLAASCHKYGMKLGVYLSPADLYHIENPDGLYGNLSKYTERTIPREVPGRPFADKRKFTFMLDDYNEYFMNQLFEVLTEYGPVDEVWFDGAHPKRKGDQQYNYAAWREMIRALVPNATIFGREDIRWCGNEAGATRDTEWNVVTYTEDPRQMNHYDDLHGDLGTRAVYFAHEKPFYLHYQPAETNTSIREGWFYRDDTRQNVRSADDVFDIYERSVGGNSIFLLNIPPNREGRFSDRDVAVLEETGRRINATYGTDLLKGAAIQNDGRVINITLPSAVTLNRLALSEPIDKSGERVEKHEVEAFINGAWVKVSESTNIGHKRIHRFNDITTDRLRVTVLESRLEPSISAVTAHYYPARPPRLSAIRSTDGMVTIEPMKQKFGWNRYEGQYDKVQTAEGIEIHYTTDGTEPDLSSPLYTAPFHAEKLEVKAVAVLKGELGTVSATRFGLVKELWIVTSNENHSIAIDLGKKCSIDGFTYSPLNTREAKELVPAGTIYISNDGKKWKKADDFIFGNIVNDPSPRTHLFKKAVKARFVRISTDSSELSVDEVDMM